MKCPITDPQICIDCLEQSYKGDSKLCPFLKERKLCPVLKEKHESEVNK